MSSQKHFFASKALSCSQCGVQDPKHFLLPQHPAHQGNESPCGHNVGVCNRCWLEYLQLEVTTAQAASEKQQKTKATEIKCVECQEPLRNIDIFMRGGSNLFDVYQSMQKSESARAAKSNAAKKGKAVAAWAFFQNRKTASAGEYNAFSEGKGK
ncbi:hypothetical protein CBER1_08686 [Cercospora berteroae]|uniref:Uncharacterized protein n=1 Tax=Cercospora berteroae TaxID=357750 RepID=A0A2S6C6N5_9PEZI|nr:hypothetical protein CBER1_08686 [Cercospora berteroae]